MLFKRIKFFCFMKTSNPSFAQTQNIVVAHKKRLYGIIVLAAVLGIVADVAQNMFQVREVVISANNNNIAAAY